MWIYERYDWMHFDWDKDTISALVKKGVVSAYPGRTRKKEYAINYVKADEFLRHFRDIRVEPGERHYLAATCNGTKVQERLSALDYEQFVSGNLSSSDLVRKYMAYLIS